MNPTVTTYACGHRMLVSNFQDHPTIDGTEQEVSTNDRCPACANTKISKAIQVFGWMDEAELEWLAFEASRHTKICEIGSYLGRSTRAMGDNTPGTVYAVDHWNGPTEIRPPLHAPELLYDLFTANVGDLIPNKIVPVRMTSMEAAEMYRKAGEQFDMVFIDGSHDLESVRHDIQAWAQLVKPGGLFCGHDAQWPGVEESRRLYLPQHMAGVGALWACDNFQGLKCQ